MFEKIVGNEQNKKILEETIKNKNISHSYMFIGKPGIGKFLFAKEFAKKILLGNNKEIKEENIPDLYIIQPDGNSIKIDQIREITKKVVEKPVASDKKVYIINDSHLMTKEAQNSLLKTLEEPPEYVIIILIAPNEDLFLPTIKSRCTKILFNKLSNSEIEEILKQNGKNNIIKHDFLSFIDGSATKAIELIGQQDIYTEISELIEQLPQKDLLDLINAKEKFFKDKEQTHNILEYMNVIIINNAVKNIKNNIKYINCIQIIENTKDRLNRNGNYDMTIDNYLISIWEEMNG